MKPVFEIARSLFAVLSVWLSVWVAGCGTGTRVVEQESLDPSKTISAELSNSSVSCFAQDRHGYIWIGTERGLNRFNGSEYTHFFHTADSTSVNWNKIRRMMLDSEGTLWVATSSGISSLCDDDTFEHYPVDTPSKNISGLFEFDGDIYCTPLGSLCRLDRASGVFRPVISDHGSSTITDCLFDERFIHLVVGSQVVRYDRQTMQREQTVRTSATVISTATSGGPLAWMATYNGLNVMDIDGGRIVPLPENLRRAGLDSIPLTSVTFYDSRRLIVTANDGRIFLYDTAREEVIAGDDPDFPLAGIGGVGARTVSRLFVDSEKNIWIAHHNQGYSVYYDYERRFLSGNVRLKKNLMDTNVTSLDYDSRGRLWIVADHTTLYLHEDQSTRRIDLDRAMGISPGAFAHIMNVFVDSDDHVWLNINQLLVECSYSGGELRQMGRYNINGSDNTNVGRSSVADYVVSSIPITEDSRGTIWAGWLSGTIYSLKKGEQRFTGFDIDQPRLTHMGAIARLRDGRIAMGFYDRDLIVLDPLTLEQESIELPRGPDDHYYITSIFENIDGDLWVGTRGEGVWRISSDRSSLRRVEGLTCNDVCSIVGDGAGNVWIATYDGLNRYDREHDRIHRLYREDGIGGNQFNYMAGRRLPDGSIAFGGNHGLTLLDNQTGVDREHHIPFYFENMFVNNVMVYPHRSDVIAENLRNCPRVVLDPGQRHVTFTYAALDYSERLRLKYSYALDDEPWVSTDNRKSVTFYKAPYGRHTLRVKVESPDNPAMSETIELAMNVRRPLPVTHVALVFYFLCGLSIALWIMYILNRLYRSRIHQHQQQRVHETKMRFLANISHEFRTPLTMINGAVSSLDGEGAIDPSGRRLLHIVHRNTDRMMRLVEQLMDFNKIEADVLRLEVRRSDAVKLVEEVTEVFNFAAEQKGIDFRVRCGRPSMPMWIDGDKFEKMIYNILSNALKFTPAAHGRIEMEVDLVTRAEAQQYFPLSDHDLDQAWILVTIADSGPGIPDDKLEQVFERYAILEEGNRMGGTGIGLYHTRRLVAMHHGYIKAENRNDDFSGGAVFTFILPTGEISYRAEMGQAADESATEAAPRLPDLPDEKSPEQGNEDHPSILVIDDDPEMLYYIKTLLAPHYTVQTAFDAAAGYKAIGDSHPDLVLCDVLMHGMDGLQLCRKVKENISMCHIPFVLLTARSTVGDQIRGLDSGANAYIVKPFDPDYLLVVIRSQLDNSNRMRNLLTHATRIPEIGESELNHQDRKFVAALYELMDKEKSNPDLNISRISEELHMSRTKLFYKMKALTGETPHAFFNHYKLNRAAEMLLEGRFKISAIAEQVGFQSASHFTTIFKKEFGCLPSEYAQMIGKKE